MEQGLNYNIGDYVVIKSDKKRYVYVVASINGSYCVLNGYNMRIQRELEFKEIEKATNKDIQFEDEKSKAYYNLVTKKNERTKTQKYVLGKILHIDGDTNYLEKCLELYEGIGLYAYGVSIEEKKIENDIADLLLDINPDIVVITGHDFYNNQGIKDLKNYKNTSNFMKAIYQIRKLRGNMCCVIAGACQSNYEALIASGADFASSPKRINIHTFDPAVIAIKVATTSFARIVDYNDIEKYIENGKDAFWGLQTYGKMRLMI